MGTRRLRLVVALAGLCSPVGVLAQQPMARASLSPAGPVTVGQPVTLTVEVFVPSFFQGAPAYAELDLDDALTIFNDRGTNLTERIDGDTWAGQSRSYTIYPQRAGIYEITDISVDVRYRGPDGNTSATASAPTVRFEARIPAEAAGLDYFVAGSRVTLAESFDIEPDTVRVGDAFTRTVTATVYDALSIVIPPLVVDSIAGIAIYPNAPRVDDTSGERGAQIVGTRVESTTYVMQLEGQYSVPALELVWWDVGAGRLRRETVPGVDFLVVANPDLVSEFDLPPDSSLAEAESEADFTRFSLRNFIAQWGPTFLAIALLLVIAFRLERRYGPRVRARMETSKQARAESEATYFRAFREATRSGDPAKSATAVMRWLDRYDAGPGPTTFSAFAEAADDPTLARQTAALDQTLYGPAAKSAGEAWSAGGFYDAVAKARKSQRGAEARHDPAGTLAPLNPEGRD